MDEARTAPHAAATRPEEALPDDAFELVGAGWREHRPALRHPGWRQRLARLPLLPLCLLLLLVLGCLCAPLPLFIYLLSLYTITITLFD